MTTQPKHTPDPITTRPIAFGVYTATDAFRAIDQHSCVCFADDMGLIAVTGRADDKEAQRWSELFAAASETAAERDQLRQVNAELVAALNEIEIQCDGAMGEWAAVRFLYLPATMEHLYFLRLTARTAIARATGTEERER